MAGSNGMAEAMPLQSHPGTDLIRVSLIRVGMALDAGARFCRFWSWLVVEIGDGIRRDPAVAMLARTTMPASEAFRRFGFRGRLVESTLVEIGDGVALDQVVTVPA